MRTVIILIRRHYADRVRARPDGRCGDRARSLLEPPATRANPLRPSWVFGDEEIAATAADYLALGHWDRPVRVGDGSVPAYYSSSPELAKTVNLVRLTSAGAVVVTREPLRC